MRRLLNSWAAGPMLLVVLIADLWWFGWHTRTYEDTRVVADVFESKECGCGSYPPYLLTWPDGDARLHRSMFDLSQRAPRPDEPDAKVIVSWGTSTWGVFAPCRRESWVTLVNINDLPPARLPSTDQVTRALSDVSGRFRSGFPPELEDPQTVAPFSRTSVLWAGVLHDAVALVAWPVALWLVVRLPVRRLRQALAHRPHGYCTECGYDVRSLLLTGCERCPECGVEAR